MNIFQNLPAPLQEALARMQYTDPTPVQLAAIPIAMAGRDLLGSAQTGTGKTGAFAIPAIAKLMDDPEAAMLVLTPTRELAEQVMEVMHQLLNKRHDIKTALLIGGVPIQKQFLRLKANPRVIIGTPGRINDHLDRRSLSLKNVKILVLDEADRMLDMGFGEQLAAIAERLPTERQTFMFSATLPKRILVLSEKFLNNPERIKIGMTHAPLAKIKQDILRTSEEGKYESLLKELDKRTGSILIFAKTKRKVDLLAQKLNQKIDTGAMHGDLRQHQRTRVLQDFRNQKYRILVATDVAARGLDIPHIEHVINYDLPQSPEDYIHRIGRTARGNAEGSSLCFISREDEKYWRAIERLLGGDESAPSMQRGAPSRGQQRQPYQSSSAGRGGSEGRSRFAARDGGGSNYRGDANARGRTASRDGASAGYRGDANPRARTGSRDDAGSGYRGDANPRSRFAAPRDGAGANYRTDANPRARTGARDDAGSGYRGANANSRFAAPSRDGNGSNYRDDAANPRARTASRDGAGSNYRTDAGRSAPRDGAGANYRTDAGNPRARSSAPRDGNGSNYRSDANPRARTGARDDAGGSNYRADAHPRARVGAGNNQSSGRSRFSDAGAAPRAAAPARTRASGPSRGNADRPYATRNRSRASQDEREGASAV